MTVLKNVTCGPVLRGPDKDLSTNQIHIWGRGKYVEDMKCFLVVRLIYDDQIHTHHTEVYKDNDCTDIVVIEGLFPDTEYTYKMGYVNVDEYIKYDTLDWTNITEYNFKTTDIINKEWNFIFGSCRIMVDFGPITLFGTGKEGDKVFQSINDHKDIEFFMQIGDQIYLDSRSLYRRTKKLKDIRKKYRKAMGFDGIKQLMATKHTYQMCDDHDRHTNNTNLKKMGKEQQVADNALKGYLEYQHIYGPSVINNSLWYTFDKYDATFFVMDTRSEKSETSMISDYQYSALKKWINEPHNEDKIKFLVSPTPVISQVTNDSFYAYPIQQRNIVDLISKHKKVIILTGDAHCCRSATYNVINENNVDIDYQVTEIVSSGFCSVSYDKGKELINAREVNIKKYDKRNDFPFIVDNTMNGGYKYVTMQSTKSYPDPCRPQNLSDCAKYIVTRVFDSVYTKILVNDENVVSQIYNHKGEMLNIQVHNFL